MRSPDKTFSRTALLRELLAGKDTSYPVSRSHVALPTSKRAVMPKTVHTQELYIMSCLFPCTLSYERMAAHSEHNDAAKLRTFSPYPRLKV